MFAFNPEKLWRLSCSLAARGNLRTAKAVKLLNFLLFHTVLPYEVELLGAVQLWHRGLGVVIHPNTRVGNRVQIAQNVTIAAGDWEVSNAVKIIIEDEVMIGAGAFLSSKKGQTLTIGRGARIGANAVIVRDVSPGAIMVGPTASDIATRPSLSS